MPDVPATPPLRERIEDLLGRRRDRWLAGAVVALVTLVAIVLLGRGSPASIAPPAQAPAASAPPAAAFVAPSPTAVVFVDVSGAVRDPGLYSLPAGARVADAVEAAGGARPRADLSLLNLAEVLADGTKVDVPRAGAAPAPPMAPAAGASGAPQAATPISLNHADQLQLESIPGVGPVTAAAILAYRDQSGGFDSVEELLEVDGIGPATLENIRPYVTL